MMDFYDACKMMYEGIRRGGHPGIQAAGDAGDFWIISAAPIEPGIIEYSIPLFSISKETEMIRALSLAEKEDWELLDSAKEMTVPIEFKPTYYKHMFKLLDIVKLKNNYDVHGVKSSYSGTIVDIHHSSSGTAYTVEFLDDCENTVEDALLTEYEAKDLILVEQHP